MKTIHWAGDWLVDEYLHGRLEGARFIPERREVLPGGALCAASFLGHLCRRLGMEHQGLFSPVEALRLTRYLEGGRLLLETYSYNWTNWASAGLEPLEPTDFYSLHAEPKNLYPYVTKKAEALLLSMYNKGMGSWLHRYGLQYRHQYPLLVVDSRYRDLDPNAIKATCKVWHATGQEFEEQYGLSYDYVVHTNGPGEIQVLAPRGVTYDTLATIPVEPIEGRSTCGAGDAFSAALCTFLVAGTTDAVRAEDVINAAGLAARYVQERIRASDGLTISP